MSSNKPFPSSDLDVFKDNSLILDFFVNSQENEHSDRFARKRPTITGIIKEAFSVRQDINNFTETLVGMSRWDPIPKNTSLSLGGDNGALNKQAQALFNRTEMLKVHAREALRRTYQEVGLNLVEGSFEEGGTLQSVTDVLLEEKTGKCYSWAGSFPKVVNKGTLPSSEVEFVLVSDKTLKDLLSQPEGVSLVGGVATASSVTILQRNLNPSCAVFSGKLVAGKATGTKVHFYGDSTMWGSSPAPNTTVQQASNPPAMFKIALDILFPGNGVVVTNKAIAGSNLYSMLRGINHYYPTTFKQSLEQDRPGIVYCGHCLNDCSSADSDTNISQYYVDLIEFVDLTRAYGAVPVLVTPMIHSPLGAGTIAQTKRQESFIQAMRDVAKKKDVDLVDSNYYTKQSMELWTPVSIAPDGVHLSPMFSSQHGFNMMIPIVNPRVLKIHGDIAGLSTTIWSDNLPETANKITNTPDSRFGPMLLGDGSATELKINFPIVLDKPTKQQFLAIGGASWPLHGVADLTYFDGYGTDGIFSGKLDRSTAVASSDSIAGATLCRLPAGFAIVGMKLPANTQVGKVFTFSGVTLLNRVFSGNGLMTQTATNLQPREILAGDVITLNPTLQSGDSLLRLAKAFDSSSVMIDLVWDKTTNAIVLKTQGTTTTIFTPPAQGSNIGVQVSISDRGVVVVFGGVTKTVGNLPNVFPAMYVVNPVSYTVNRP